MEKKNSKKFTSKKEKKIKIETRDWRVGDLVKVSAYDITGLPTFSYGIITAAGNDAQTKIFPCFKVYDFRRQIEEIVNVYNLEIVSAAS